MQPPLAYSAPELVGVQQGEPNSPAADTFSLGGTPCLCWSACYLPVRMVMDINAQAVQQYLWKRLVGSEHMPARGLPKLGCLRGCAATLTAGPAYFQALPYLTAAGMLQGWCARSSQARVS